jgi:hypothetical protein
MSPNAILDDINPIAQPDRGLVAGVGFEPTIRQLPDYEPDGGRPVREKNPLPRPWRLSLFSSFRASERESRSLLQTRVQGPFPFVQREMPVLCSPNLRGMSSERPT